MKKFKITKRDVLFFILGFLVMVVIDTVHNWSTYKQAFIEGMEDARVEEKTH
jgi:hypothetical protein